MATEATSAVSTAPEPKSSKSTQASDLQRGTMLCSEIQAVITIMRQNSKWALVPGGYGFDEGEPQEDPLLEKFRKLRRQVFVWKDWSSLNPSMYLMPFLEVIRSVETSGPITGMALSTVQRILSQGLITKSTPEAAEAMHSIADAVAHCRFEETDPDSDEGVLAKILQALLACLRCPAGDLLSDDDVCNIVQACFRIGHHTGKEGELLQQLVRQTMHEMVRHIFGRLGDMPPVPSEYVSHLLSPHHAHIADVGSKQPLSPKSPRISAEAAPDPAAEDGPSAPPPLPDGTLGPPYGLPCILEVFQFLVSLISVDDAGAEDLCVFGLTLINSALEEGGETFAKHPIVLNLVRDDLFRSLMAVGTCSNVSVLAFLCTVFLNLYLNLRVYLKYQLEAFMRGVILMLGDGRHVAYDQQRVALEAVVDLCRQPAFMADMYTNYDCNLEGSNMFEDVCNLLSKNAFPVNCPLSAVHLLSLEGLSAMLATIADRASSSPSSDVKSEETFTLTEYYNFWSEVAPSGSDEDARASWLRNRKALKRQLSAAMEHFNRDSKKGFEYLTSIKMLPDPNDAESIANFFRYCPGLDKAIVGEYLGDAKEFKVKVLEKYATSFDFTGMTIDSALRLFLEGFLLPGEAQKISRILEYFASTYYTCSQKSDGVVADSDAVYVLSYSIIMLNTDLHNKQVKRKMTLDQFISNNRGTNGGKDWPRQLLTDIYTTISQDEIKLSADGEVSSSRWADVMRRSQTEHGAFLCNESSRAYDADLFTHIWEKAIAAMSVVFEHTDEESVLQEVLEGFSTIAKIASAQQQMDVVDNLISSLCRFTTLLNPSVKNAAVAFGENQKARLATMAAFGIVTKYGGLVRGGWRNILDCILRLYKLGLLPAKVTDPEGGIMSEAERSAPARPARLEKKSSSTSSLFRGIQNSVSQLLSLDSTDSLVQVSEGEAEAEARTVRCIEICRIEEILHDSVFLEAESLLTLVRALIWAAGVPSASSSSSGKGGGGVVEDEDIAMFCLDQVVSVTLRNRDRFTLLWPLVFEHYSDIVQGATAPGPLVERAVVTLVRICQRLLPYKEELAGQLLQSLQLLFKLQEKVAENLVEQISKEVLRLIKGSVGYIKSEAGWQIVCKLIHAGSCHMDAAPVAFEALVLVTGDASIMSRENFVPCLEASLGFAGRGSGLSNATKAVDVLAGLHANLAVWAGQGDSKESVDEIKGMWTRLVEQLTKLCVEPRPEVRNHAVVALQRVILAADGINFTPDLWFFMFDSLVLPLINDLAQAVKDRKAELPDAERTLRLVVTMHSKAFLHFLPKLKQLPNFKTLWLNILEKMHKCVKCSKGEELAEAVPESLKNILLVMSKMGILSPDAKEGLWEDTWKSATLISSSLVPDVLTLTETQVAA